MSFVNHKVPLFQYIYLYIISIFILAQACPSNIARWRERKWKLILDLRPNTMEKDIFMEDKQCKEKVPSLDKSSSIPSMTPSMTQAYTQQLEQLRNAIKYHDPYKAQAIQIQSTMD